MISSLPSYPAYKDSGLPWPGRIPAHWELRRLKQICQLIYGDSLPSDGRVNGAVPVFGSNGVVGRHDKANTTAPCIIVGRKGSFGKVNFSSKPVFAIDTTYYIDDRFTRSNLRWLYYLLGWMRLDAVSKDSAVPGLAREDAYQKQLPVPPLPEQRTIARYLDWADARIARLIDARERQVKLLEETKQALIHQAVTGQIDVRTGKPYAEYKDSGVEWLGKVPTHWEVVALRHRYHSELGKMLDAKRITGECLVPYVRNIDVQWDHVNTDNLAQMDIKPKEYARYTLRKGDLLVCEGGEVGRCAIWNGDLALCGFQKAIHRVRHIDQSRDNTRFLYYVMRAAAQIGVFIADGSENTIAHLTGVKLRKHRFAFPQKNEQNLIVEFLDARIAKIDTAIAATHRTIDLLKEYRTRLIADVVTGKVDVREAISRPSHREKEQLMQEVV
jgi:type I restriction enzyme S subunit